MIRVNDTISIDDREIEERFVRAALVRTGGHRGRAASELGVTSAPAAPWSARAPISTLIDGASAHASDSTPKAATPMRTVSSSAAKMRAASLGFIAA